jgi:hypothetical protein
VTKASASGARECHLGGRKGKTEAQPLLDFQDQVVGSDVGSHLHAHGRYRHATAHTAGP